MYKIQIEVNLEQELLKEIKEDKVAQVIDNVFKLGKLDYYDICTLRGVIKTNKTKFNHLEIRWFSYNYRLWLKIIKSKLGRKVFMKFFRYGNNVHKVTKELQVSSRSMVYYWTNKFQSSMILKPRIVNYYGRSTNENLLILDQASFPKLVPLTAIYIKQQIANETLK